MPQIVEGTWSIACSMVLPKYLDHQVFIIECYLPTLKSSFNHKIYKEYIQCSTQIFSSAKGDY